MWSTAGLLWLLAGGEVELGGRQGPVAAAFHPGTGWGAVHTFTTASGSTSLAGRSAAPYPTRRVNVVVSLDLLDSEDARLDVLDERGRLVWSQPLDALGPGEQLVRLKPDRPLRAGVYVLRLLQDGREQRSRFTVVD